MGYAEFYNLNANILYPFVTPRTDAIRCQDGYVLRNEVIVDCGFTLGPKADFNPETSAVYLHSITRGPAELLLTFRTMEYTQDPLLEFEFAVYYESLFGHTQYVEAAGGPLYGVGFVAVGNVLDTYNDLIVGETKYLMAYDVPGKLTQYEATVEPALVVSQRRHAVYSVSVGNLLRIADGAYDGCGSPPTPPDSKTVKLQMGASKMVGNIRFQPGYNIAVNVNKPDESLSIAAVVGEGLGEVCDVDLVRYEGDIPDLGDRCKDFIFTINGIPPNSAGAFQIEGGGSFVVHPVEQGSIVINSRLGTQTVCGTDNG